MTWLYPHHLGPPDRVALMADWLAIRDDPSGFLRLICLAGGEVIGSVRIEIDLMSFFVARPYRGRGYGFRAVALSVQGWAERGGGPLQAFADRDNVASIRILEGNGFVFRGPSQGLVSSRYHHRYVRPA